MFSNRWAADSLTQLVGGERDRCLLSMARIICSINACNPKKILKVDSQISSCQFICVQEMTNFDTVAKACNVHMIEISQPEKFYKLQFHDSTS